MKKIVLDTNVLLVCISEKSALHWKFQKFLEKAFTLCVTTEILSEYAEIIEAHMGVLASEDAINIIVNSSNTQFITTYYKFQLLKDEDDNKFVDCAIAANADFIVSHDKDFKALGTIDFPKMEVINTVQFKERL